MRTTGVLLVAPLFVSDSTSTFTQQVRALAHANVEAHRVLVLCVVSVAEDRADAVRVFPAKGLTIYAGRLAERIALDAEKMRLQSKLDELTERYAALVEHKLELEGHVRAVEAAETEQAREAKRTERHARELEAHQRTLERRAAWLESLLEQAASPPEKGGFATQIVTALRSLLRRDMLRAQGLRDH